MALHEQDRFGNLVPVGFLSRLTFSWINNTLKHGNRSQIQDKDLLVISDKYSSESLVEVLENTWKEEEHLAGMNPDRTCPLLLKVLFKSFRFHLSILCLLMVFDLLFRVLIAVLVGALVGQLQSLTSRAYIYAGLLGGTTWLYAVLRNYHLYRLHGTGTQLATSIMGLIYKKVLTLNQKSLNGVTSGHLTRLVSIDCKKIQTASFFLTHLAIFPLEVIIITALSWKHINWLSLIATCFVVGLIPIQMALTRLCTKIQHKATRLSKQRLHLMENIVKGIRIAKMNVWESPLSALVSSIRRCELRFLRKTMVVLSFQQMMQFCSVTIISIIVFPSMMFLGEALTPEKVFSTLVLYSCLVQSVLEDVSRGTERIPQAITAMQRIEHFMKMEDTCSKEDIHLCRVVGNSRFFVNDGFDRLENPRSTFPTNILSFDGLTNRSQAAGIVKENDCKRVSRLCIKNASFSWSIKRHIPALSDISLDLDDNTLLGVTGSQGAGKTALLLATLQEMPLVNGHLSNSGRAVYVPQVPWVFTGTLRDNILFNTPFAEDRYWKVIYACALDKDIGEFPNGDLTLVEQGGVTLTTDQRTRVSLARAAYCEADIYLFDDNFSLIDKTSEIMGKLIRDLLSNTCRVVVSNDQNVLEQCSHVVVMDNGRVKQQGTFSQVKALLLNTWSHESRERGNEECCDTQIHQINGGHNEETSIVSCDPLMDDVIDDAFPVGVSGWPVYWKYLRTGRSASVVTFLALLLVTRQCIVIFTDWWLARWSNMDHGHQNYKPIVYIFFGVAAMSVVLAWGRSVSVFFTLLRTSEYLHTKMVTAVLKAQVCFFDSTPLERILQRFSKDTHNMDISLPYGVSESIKTVVSVISVILVSIVVNYWVSLAAVPLLVLTVFLRRLLDDKTCSSMMFNAGIRWLCLRVELVCSMFVLAISLAAVATKANAGYAGMSLLYAIQMLTCIQWTVIATEETQSMMSSFTRVLSYSTLKPEPGYAKEHFPREDWPEGGGIKCEDLSYENEAQEILKSTDLNILPKEKIAVVGQKGSGTTSLIAALLRMPQPNGRVIIDGINISDLSLKDSRRPFGLVPHRPKLFSTSLRFNLDPLGKFRDDTLWSVLEQLQLKSKVLTQLGSRLNGSISGFTTTELKLVALAHALLEGKNILIIHEDEANGDWSNKLIQDVIGSHFQDHTVITIAFSLDTIMSSDRVLVMRDGCVLEFDKPEELSSQGDNELMDILAQSTSTT